MGAIGGKAIHGIGKTRGGWASKIHVAVDALGNPLEILVTEGQVNDNVPAEKLIKNKDSIYVIADKAYDTDAFREAIQRENKEAVIPPGGTRRGGISYDKHLYKERHLIECFFQRLKKWRRIATRYEKALEMYVGMIHIGCVLIWLSF